MFYNSKKTKNSDYQALKFNLTETKPITDDDTYNKNIYVINRDTDGEELRCYLHYNDENEYIDSNRNEHNAIWDCTGKKSNIKIETDEEEKIKKKIYTKINGRRCGLEYYNEYVDGNLVKSKHNAKWDCGGKENDSDVGGDPIKSAGNKYKSGDSGDCYFRLHKTLAYGDSVNNGIREQYNAYWGYCGPNLKLPYDGNDIQSDINVENIEKETQELPSLVLTKEVYKKGVYYFTNTKDNKKSYLSFDAETQKLFLSDNKKYRWKWRIVSKKEIPILEIKKNQDVESYLFKLSYNTLKQSFVITNKDSNKGYFYHKFEMDKNILNFNIKKDESKLKFYQDGTLVFEMLDDSTEGNYDVSLPEYDENNFDKYLRNVDNNISNIKIFDIDNPNKLDFLIYENKMNDYFQPLGPNIKSEINPNTQKLTPKKINCKYEVVNNKIKRDNVQTNDLFSYKVGRITNNKKTDYVSCDIADFSIYTTNSPTPTIVKKIGEQLLKNENNALNSLYYPFVKTDKDTEKEIEEKNTLMKVMEPKRIEILNNNDKLFSETKDTYKTNSNNYTDGGDNKGYNYKICMYRKNNVSIFSEAKPLVNEENYNTSPTLKPGI